MTICLEPKTQARTREGGGASTSIAILVTHAAIALRSGPSDPLQTLAARHAEADTAYVLAAPLDEMDLLTFSRRSRILVVVPRLSEKVDMALGWFVRDGWFAAINLKRATRRASGPARMADDAGTIDDTWRWTDDTVVAFGHRLGPDGT
jgi:hypothetical protein